MKCVNKVFFVSSPSSFFLNFLAKFDESYRIPTINTLNNSQQLSTLNNSLKLSKTLNDDDEPLERPGEDLPGADRLPEVLVPG